jgi:hypothetical protein
MGATVRLFPRHGNLKDATSGSDSAGNKRQTTHYSQFCCWAASLSMMVRDFAQSLAKPVRNVSERWGGLQTSSPACIRLGGSAMPLGLYSASLSLKIRSYWPG